MKPNRNINDLIEPFRTKVQLWFDECKNKGIPINASRTFATAEEQKEVYLKGASKLDGINKISMHQKGLAVDIYFLNDINIYPKEEYKWEFIANIARKYGIIWPHEDLGWKGKKFIDMPHFQDNGQPLKSPESFIEEKIDEQKKEIQNKTNLKNKMEISGYIYAPKEIEDQMNFIIRKAQEKGIKFRIENPNPIRRADEMARVASELKQITHDEEFSKILDASEEIAEHFKKQEEHFNKEGVYLTYPTNA